MKTNLRTILNIKNYFVILKSAENCINFTLGEPSRILLSNIYTNWLKFLYTKTHKHIPVYINKLYKNVNNKVIPYGYIDGSIPRYDKEREWVHKLSDFGPENRSQLQVTVVIPRDDVMQHFMQWQRYRKYWWSSISTTPSLFSLNDMKHEDNLESNVNVMANFPSGPRPVETITVKGEESTSSLTCSMSLESALFVLLLDGMNNRSKEGYLRLHRKMAPYKISFAIDPKDEEHKKTLLELVSLLYHKLETKSIPAWQPDFSLPLADQIKESLQMGVTYTAVLNGTTLNDGIFHLLNSSTMLKEQVHVADFHSYAALLFGDK
ncbi:DNA polymerase subunit gamma-2, mitochondrial [Manduca sexta]|nr:DNA polymerase subunit gamma-2, mitochondrial [Manduca sexta]